jgi:hypothetical protein
MMERHIGDIDYDRSTRRLYWLTFVIAVSGTAISWALWGTRVGAGFGLGSMGSFVNLWVWHAIADGLGGRQTGRSMAAGALFAGRFLALFALGYVIVRTLNVQPFAAILGLLTSSLAVLAEIIIELASSWRLSR